MRRCVLPLGGGRAHPKQSTNGKSIQHGCLSNEANEPMHHTTTTTLWSSPSKVERPNGPSSLAAPYPGIDVLRRGGACVLFFLGQDGGI